MSGGSGELWTQHVGDFVNKTWFKYDTVYTVSNGILYEEAMNAQLKEALKLIVGG